MDIQDQAITYLHQKRIEINFQRTSLLYVVQALFEFLIYTVPEVKEKKDNQDLLQNLRLGFETLNLAFHFNFGTSYLDLDLDYDSSETFVINVNNMD